ncbi:MAG TPA: hypothetical protein VMI52_02900 [Acetobacteraceae bacterium]|nr:hypothetical protein [Acetobacteraceae bacterium]
MSPLIARVLALLALAPLILLPVIVLVGLLTGAISAGGIWRDSFDTTRLSPSRILQFVLAVMAAGTILFDVVDSGATHFAPLPPWLTVTAGGGNVVYLGLKLASSRGWLGGNH